MRVRIPSSRTGRTGALLTCAVVIASGLVLTGFGPTPQAQADVSPGTPGTILVGRPDPSLNEARDRCRMAISNSDVQWPVTRRVTILLSRVRI